MRKRKLNKKGKILFTILTTILSAIVYYLMIALSKNIDNNVYELIIVAGWIWLLVGQIIVYSNIWYKGDDNDVFGIRWQIKK